MLRSTVELMSTVELRSKVELRVIQKERSFLEFGTLTSFTTEVSVGNEGLRESVSQVVVGVVASEIVSPEVLNAEVLDSEVVDSEVVDSEVLDTEVLDTEIVGILGVPVVEPVVVGGEGYSVLKVLVSVESPEVVLPGLR